ncbi:MAG TPA: hypothetical protein VFN67_03590 [Polyangiales bacterium]|nr:hypothetical protein [Polyangiales bacterium]
MTTEADTKEPQPDAADERTRALANAYAQGDFRHLRVRARELAQDDSAPPAVRERARAWSARVSVDVVVYAMLAFAFALFCAIVIRYALP